MFIAAPSQLKIEPPGREGTDLKPGCKILAAALPEGKEGEGERKGQSRMKRGAVEKQGNCAHPACTRKEAINHESLNQKFMAHTSKHEKPEKHKAQSCTKPSSVQGNIERREGD